MLTVKVVNGQRETVSECAEVSLIERGLPGGPIPSFDDRILFAHSVNGTNEIRQIDAGEIYVMNEAGSTVARYRLGNEVTPGTYAVPKADDSANVYGHARAA